MARKSLSKKIRFEVFKRDSFKCQYCGSSSPDVVLEVDHIKPVVEGGTNDITNLITSCFDCNRGKGPKLLDDNTIIEKQRKQLEDLNERRQQLEMMMEWRESLASLDIQQMEALKNQWENSTGFSISENGARNIKKWVKKYHFNLLLDCLDISVAQYLEYDEESKPTLESAEKAFNMIPRIVVNKLNGEEPYMKDLYYIRGILKNRLNYVDPVKAIRYLKLAHIEADISIESLKRFAKEVRHWTGFRSELEQLFEDEDIDY